MSRPWRRRLSIGLVLTLAAAWLGWYRWLPEYRPSLRAGERYGIDVAHHQGTIDWQRVARDGIAVAYIKATEGGDLIDPSFIANWRGADDAGSYEVRTTSLPSVEPGSTRRGSSLTR